MNAEVRRHRVARRDLEDIFYRFAREGRLAVARRFLAQAEATFVRLAARPGIGARYDSEDMTFAEVRVCPVSRFKTYLVFYRPIAGGVEVLRVLHGARDLPGLLAEDLGLAADAGDPEPQG